MTYAEKLRDPRWQKRRLEIFERDKFTCHACESTTKTLTVHHHYYVKGREPWDYPDWALQTLCSDCHEITQVLGATEYSVFEWFINLLCSSESDVSKLFAGLDDLRCQQSMSREDLMALMADAIASKRKESE